MARDRPGVSNMCSSDSVEVPKESVLLDGKRAFPLRVYGRR
jgi:hypothetical protein